MMNARKDNSKPTYLTSYEQFLSSRFPKTLTPAQSDEFTNAEIIYTPQNTYETKKHTEHSADEKISVSNDDRISKDEEYVETKMKLYECTVCSFETIYESVFKVHLHTHRRRETFHKCPKCLFKVMCKARLKKHMVTEGKGYMWCGLNAYSEECKDVLRKHQLKHKNGSKEGSTVDTVT